MHSGIVLVCLVAFVATVTVAQKRQCCEDYCYDDDNDKPQSAHYGTKTAYQIVKGSSSRGQFALPSKCTHNTVLNFKTHLMIPQPQPQKMLL